MPESELARRAAAMTTAKGGFPSQTQRPPGATERMRPIPDHGEETYRGSGRLEGLRALVTGGDSGIGRAVSLAFAREGADVAISYLPEEHEDAKQTRALVEDAERTAVLVPGDLTTRTMCQDVAAQAFAALGGLNILVNNAGYQMARGAGLGDLDPDQLDQVLKTNLYAMFWLTQAVLPHLQRGDSIINCSSVQAYDPSPKLLDYAATKAAMVNFTVNLAAELGPRGIRVNAVAPGPIWTPLQPATQHAERIETFGSDTPLGRAGQPGEVAPAFVFLASPGDASYVSGSVLGVTGGKPVF